MFNCERCGASFSPIRAAMLELCPRCWARHRARVPLVVEAARDPTQPETIRAGGGPEDSDIDLARAEISVHQSWDQHEGPIAPKSKAGTRTVPLLGVLRERLDLGGTAAASDLVFERETGEEALSIRRRSTIGPSVRGRRPTSARSRLPSAGGASPICSSRSRSTVPPCFRVTADRRRGQPQGNSGVHGARNDRGDVFALRAPDARHAQPGPRVGRRLHGIGAGCIGDFAAGRPVTIFVSDDPTESPCLVRSPARGAG